MKDLITPLMLELKHLNIKSNPISQSDFAQFTCDSSSYKKTTSDIMNTNTFKDNDLSIYTITSKNGRATFNMKSWI